MKISFVFVRAIFVALSAAIGAIMAPHWDIFENQLASVALGAMAGTGFSLAMIALERMFKSVSIRSLTTLTLGIFLGAFFAQGILFLLHSLLKVSFSSSTLPYEQAVYAAIYLGAVYLSLIIVARGSDQIHLSIPFVKFQAAKEDKRDFLLDSSILCDTRLIDLAASGLVNNLLVIPRFVLNNLHLYQERGSDLDKSRAKRCLETVKKLQQMQTLALRYHECEFSGRESEIEKILQLARSIDAHVLTADMSEIQQSAVQDVTVVRFQKLCQALKPLAYSGEQLTIKVQRYGKEPRQGIGYLEDGTMVVVNGGAEFIGETIAVQVLSVKHSQSGRIIFCNALEEILLGQQEENKSELPALAY